MSDELKWWEIQAAVWERGPCEKAQRAVLVQLARHSDAAGVTFVGQPKMAERSGFSETTVKRAIAALEYAGWIRIEERAALVETRRGFERKGNLYRLDLVKLGLALPKKQTGVEGVRPAGVTSDVEGGRPVAALHGAQVKTRVEGSSPARPLHGAEAFGSPCQGRIGWSGKAEETASARSHLEVGEVSLEARRGVIGGAPLINIFEPEEPEHEEPPYAPPCRLGNVETSERQPQKQKLPDQGGGSTNVVVFPKRQRQPREARSASVVRKDDGEDAALWDETTRVMRACGVSPESSGRKVRRAVLEALRLECERSGATIANVGNLAVKRWQEYEAVGSFLYSPVGVTRFFASADGDNWLRPQMWKYDRREMSRQEDFRNATIGRWSGKPGAR